MCFRADSDSLTFPHSGHLSEPGLRNGPGVIGLLAGAQGKLTVNSSVIHQIEMGQIDKWEDGFKPLWCHRHINFPVWLTGVECPGCHSSTLSLKFEIKKYCVLLQPSFWLCSFGRSSHHLKYPVNMYMSEVLHFRISFSVCFQINVLSV